jgi:hypothetical protein
VKLGHTVPTTDSVGGENQVFITATPHSEHIGTRLGFIQYVASSLAAVLSVPWFAFVPLPYLPGVYVLICTCLCVCVCACCASVCFDRFLLSVGTAPLSIAQVKTLWEECIVNNVTAAEREAFLDWFSTCTTDDTRPGSTSSSFADDVLDHVRSLAVHPRGAVRAVVYACLLSWLGGSLTLWAHLGFQHQHCAGSAGCLLAPT